MAANQKHILCIPGIGHPAMRDQWFATWEARLREVLSKDGYDEAAIQFAPFRYRDEFRVEVDGSNYAEALADLGFGTGDDTYGRLFRSNGGIDPLAEALKWRAATIVHWATNSDLRKKLADDLCTLMIQKQPDVLLAHSLGSLIAYDALLKLNPTFLSNRSLITFGSQLGNPYVRNLYAGRITSLAVQQWYHLFNRHDSVFTSPLHVQAANFALVNVTFDNEDPLDHTAISTGLGSVHGYLDHCTTRQLVWPNVLRSPEKSPFVRSVRRSMRYGTNLQSADHRALLIGVDEYANPRIPSLAGCVNDTYLMSESLQAAGFPAANIRMLHNARATRETMMDRIFWLLDDIEEDGVPELRILHFSGHGARIASYGVGEVTDRLDECLCPHDFNWSVESSILDDLFCALYAQLPYDAHLLVILDCCHSGGMARNGESVRGLSGPRDIAHRSLYYLPGNAETPHGIWRGREDAAAEDMPHTLKNHGKHPFMINDSFHAAEGIEEERMTLWLGKQRVVRKIGRSASLRKLGYQEYDQRREQLRHFGPYLPTIFEACKEDEPAMEHVQGSTAYGAFTFSLAQALRAVLAEGQGIVYPDLLQRSMKLLKTMGYMQTPQLLMPKSKERLEAPNLSSMS